MKITELKKKALETCIGNWGILVGITILFLLISLAMVSSGAIGGILTMTAIFPLIYFVYVKCLILKRTNKNGIKIRETNITLRMAWNYIKYNLWLTLLCVPGILLIFIGTWFTLRPIANRDYADSIFSVLTPTSITIFFLCIIISCVYFILVKLVYSLTIYIIAETNDCDSTLKLMKEARLLIKGNIIKFILLKLSFIGWAILANITFSIGYLWLLPYMELTTIEFYYSLKENKEFNI